MHKEQLHYDQIFLIHDFFDAGECRHLIGLSEETGYEEATITTRAGAVMNKNYRNNDRILFDDPDVAANLYGRARPFLPDEWGNRPLVGFNERFRFYRYEVGQYFAPHPDGAFERENGERSRLTFLIYLNDDFEGGETVFHARESLVVTPKAGMALVFYHPQIHEGREVTAGCKYILRTDVMYGPVR